MPPWTSSSPRQVASVKRSGRHAHWSVGGNRTELRSGDAAGSISQPASQRARVRNQRERPDRCCCGLWRLFSSSSSVTALCPTLATARTAPTASSSSSSREAVTFARTRTTTAPRLHSPPQFQLSKSSYGPVGSEQGRGIGYLRPASFYGGGGAHGRMEERGR